MPIGTSKGAFHEDDFRHEASPWFIDPKLEEADNNIIDPDLDTGPKGLSDPVINAQYKPDKGYTDFFNSTSPTGQLSNRGIQGFDYDYSGFFQDNPDVVMTPGQHYPDTYKKPNHPTFSDESKWNGAGYFDREGNVAKAQGGNWGKDDDGNDTFTPGKTNFDHHTPQEMIDYFKKFEPKSKLILPGQ